jgi:hypothetical protein
MKTTYDNRRAMAADEDIYVGEQWQAIPYTTIK